MRIVRNVALRVLTTAAQADVVSLDIPENPYAVATLLLSSLMSSKALIQQRNSLIEL